MSFKDLYDAGWHNPYAFWAVGVGFALLLARRLPFLAGYFVVFLVEILGDALQSGHLGEHLPLGHLQRQLVAVAFVILGDLRWLLLVTRYAGSPRPLAVATGVAFVVPVTTFASMAAAPHLFSTPNRFFALYELAFLAVAAAVQVRFVSRAALEPDVRRWLGRLFGFELAQYALWLGADALILAGLDVGWGVRLVPNFLYYAAFLPFALLTAPRRLLAA